MQRQEQKRLLKEVLTFLEKNGKWIGEPILILNYLKSSTRFFILFIKDDITFYLNIDISDPEFWSSSYCRETSLKKQLLYLRDRMNPRKHIVLLDKIMFKIYYNITAQF